MNIQIINTKYLVRKYLNIGNLQILVRIFRDHVQVECINFHIRMHLKFAASMKQSVLVPDVEEFHLSFKNVALQKLDEVQTLNRSSPTGF